MLSKSWYKEKRPNRSHNYRPVRLLSIISSYLHTQINYKRNLRHIRLQRTHRINRLSEWVLNQDHIETVNQAIEKTNEYRKSLCLAFASCRRAFNSVYTAAVTHTIRKQGVEENNSRIQEYIYTDGIAINRLHADTWRAPVKRRIRQSNTVSFKLLKACLWEMIRKLK